LIIELIKSLSPLLRGHRKLPNLVKYYGLLSLLFLCSWRVGTYPARCLGSSSWLLLRKKALAARRSLASATSGIRASHARHGIVCRF